jgi:hypothetical protein
VLLTIGERRVEPLLRAFRARRIRAVAIGTVRGGQGVQAYRGGQRVRFGWSPRDELTRLG